jgi:hypothetical protein
LALLFLAVLCMGLSFRELTSCRGLCRWSLIENAPELLSRLFLHMALRSFELWPLQILRKALSKK